MKTLGVGAAGAYAATLVSTRRQESIAFAAETGVPVDEVINLANNENPMGPGQPVLDAVANALGVTLEKDPEEMIDYGKEVAYLHKPSMLQDVEAQRITEIDTINGGVAAIGDKIGVPCPLNTAIARMIKGLEHSWTLEA